MNGISRLLATLIQFWAPLDGVQSAGEAAVKAGLIDTAPPTHYGQIVLGVAIFVLAVFTIGFVFGVASKSHHPPRAIKRRARQIRKILRR